MFIIKLVITMIHASASLITQAGQHYFLVAVPSFRLEIPGVSYRLILPMKGWVWTGKLLPKERGSALAAPRVCLFNWTIGWLNKILLFFYLPFLCLKSIQPGVTECDTAPDTRTHPHSACRMMDLGFRGRGLRMSEHFQWPLQTQGEFWWILAGSESHNGVMLLTGPP